MAHCDASSLFLIVSTDNVLKHWKRIRYKMMIAKAKMIAGGYSVWKKEDSRYVICGKIPPSMIRIQGTIQSKAWDSEIFFWMAARITAASKRIRNLYGYSHLIVLLCLFLICDACRHGLNLSWNDISLTEDMFIQITFNPSQSCICDTPAGKSTDKSTDTIPDGRKFSSKYTDQCG